VASLEGLFNRISNAIECIAPAIVPLPLPLPPLPLPLPVPVPPPSSVHKTTAAEHFADYINKCKQHGNVWLTMDEVIQMLRLFRENDTLSGHYFMVNEKFGENGVRAFIWGELDP